MKAEIYPPIATPEGIPKHFVKAWNEGNPDKLAAIFDEDAEFVNVVGLWWHNREDIRKAHDYGLKVIFNESTLEIRHVKVKYLSDTIAVIHAKFRLSGQTPVTGIRPATRNNIFSFVVHRHDRGWSCVSAQNTEIIPSQETFIVQEDGKAQAIDYRSSS